VWPLRYEQIALNHLFQQKIKDVTTVAIMADRISFSPRHLARIFWQETGLTPAQWLERERVSKARLLIERENPHSKKLTSECGFSGPDVMRRVFSRLNGITPADYRKMIKRRQFDRRPVPGR